MTNFFFYTKIAGLNSTFDSFYDKIIGFAKFLRENEEFDDNDAMVIFDAYDVILTPGARRIAEVSNRFGPTLCSHTESTLILDFIISTSKPAPLQSYSARSLVLTLQLDVGVICHCLYYLNNSFSRVDCQRTAFL